MEPCHDYRSIGVPIFWKSHVHIISETITSILDYCKEISESVRDRSLRLPVPLATLVYYKISRNVRYIRVKTDAENIYRTTQLLRVKLTSTRRAIS